MSIPKLNQFLTLDKTLDDQKDLDKLCKDRPLYTEELFKPNAYYGNDYILKSFAGIPLHKPLKVLLEHGIRISSNAPILKKFKTSFFPVIFYYSPLSYKLYKHSSHKILIHSASPFCYLLKLIDTNLTPSRKGTIFFPTHSTHWITTTSNYENISKKLDALDERFKPITICIYWRDYNLGHHKPFEKMGFKIVSGGHMYDPFFLFRFYHLCSLHQYSASNYWGSHFFYSIKSGCSYFHLKDDNDNIEINCDNPEMAKEYSPPSKIFINIERLFQKPSKKMSKKQLELIDIFLGAKYLETPQKLTEVLNFADRLDKFGFARHPKTSKTHYKVPNLLPRKLLRKIKTSLRRET